MLEYEIDSSFEVNGLPNFSVYPCLNMDKHNYVHKNKKYNTKKLFKVKNKKLIKIITTWYIRAKIYDDLKIFELLVLHNKNI